MPEQRGHNRLSQYWELLRGTRDFPRENELDSDAIEDIWPSCFLISIDDVTRRLGYRYSYLGEELIEAFGDDGTNPDIALQLLSTAEMPMAIMFDTVRKSNRPAVSEAEFVNRRNLLIKYRATLLPLGEDPQNMTHILGYMGWKVT